MGQRNLFPHGTAAGAWPGLLPKCTLRPVCHGLRAPQPRSEVQDRTGRWHLLRIRPYRTRDNKIEGAVVVLIDIDDLKRSRDLSRDLRAIIETVRQSLVLLDQDARVKTANQYFYNTFRTTAAQTEGRVIFEVAEGQLDLPDVHNLLSGARSHDTRWQNVKIELEQPDKTKREMS